MRSRQRPPLMSARSLALTLPMGAPPGRNQLASFGGAISLYVAGMKQSLYNMRGVVQFADGTQFNDADQASRLGRCRPGHCRA